MPRIGTRGLNQVADVSQRCRRDRSHVPQVPEERRQPDACQGRQGHHLDLHPQERLADRLVRLVSPSLPLLRLVSLPTRKRRPSQSERPPADRNTRLAAQQLGGPANGVYFLPHGEYGAQAQRNLGASTVNAGYPVDHLHPGPFIADAMAKSFVLALRCGTTALGDLVRNSTSSLTSTYLGPCIGPANSTISALLR